MADRSVKLVITGDTKRAIAALEDLGVRASVVGKRMEHTFGDSIEGAAAKSSGALSKLSSALGAFGLPFTGAIDKVGEHLAETQTKGQKFGTALSEAGKVATLGIAAGAATIGVESLKAAGNFQQSMSKLVTSGGETSKNLKGDMAGVLKLMGDTGTSADQLSAGLYTINSAGFHGADGLNILKAAAQGAKTEGADLGEVTDGLTTLLNDYHLKASDAALVTSKMVTATSLGKTTFQDLAGSLHTVSPAADAAGLSMNQVLGAMATMTAKGTPAAEAATYLRQTILQLSNPSAKAANEMAALGLNSVDVSKNLGKRGLTGTLDLLTSAIASKMGPSGTVMVNSLKAAAAAGSGWQAELAKMTPAQQAQINTLAAQGAAMDTYKANLAALTSTQRTLVNAQASGTTNTVAYQRAFAAQTPAMRAHIDQLAAGAKTYRDYQASVAALPAQYRNVLNGAIASKEGFRDLTSTIAQLPPTEQTAVGALADMVGGTKSMQAALELTGDSASTFAANVAKVGKTTTEAHGNVAGFGIVQGNLNQQLAEARGKFQALEIDIGLKLIPKVQELAKDTANVVGWFEKHKAAADALGIAIGGTLAVAIGAFTVNKLAGMVKGIAGAAKSLADLTKSAGNAASKMLGIKGLDGAGKGAAGALDESAGKLDTAQEGLTEAASKLAAAAEQLVAAGDRLAGAGTTAAEEITTGAATAQGDLAAGGATAEAEMAAGGATAEAEEAAGGAGGKLGGIGGKVGGALGVAAAGVAAYQLTTLGLDKVFGKPQNVKPSTSLTSNTRDFVAAFMAGHAAQIAANPQLAAWDKQGDTADILHYFNNQPGAQSKSVTGGAPASTSTNYNIGQVVVQAQNPTEMSDKLRRQARLAALAGGSARSGG